MCKWRGTQDSWENRTSEKLKLRPSQEGVQCHTGELTNLGDDIDCNVGVVGHKRYSGHSPMEVSHSAEKRHDISTHRSEYFGNCSVFAYVSLV